MWKDSGTTLTFSETDAPEFSTVHSFSDCDCHGETRKSSKQYDVTTISFNDLLQKYNAPQIIDYLSIDTEGTEYEILSSLDWGKYSFRVITCEHNNTDARGKLFKLLTEKGYRRKFETLSKWDDWYVKC